MTDKIKNCIQKFISYFVILFCFIFFPLFLFYTFSDIYYKTQTDRIRQEKLSEMNKSLEYLNKYSSNKRYLHYLLSKIAEYAEKSNNPQEYIGINISNLKNKYPEKFKFVVWNEKGELIKDLSDKTGYNYALKKTYESLKAVSEEVSNDSTVKISKIKPVKQNLNLLKNFLGKMFIPENLKFPLINSNEAGPITMELSQEYAFVWFSIHKRISFLCFISEKLINDSTGLAKISEKLSDNNSQIIYGFSNSLNYEKPVTKFPVEYESNINLALSTFENGGDNIFENDRALIKMLMPQSNIRTFAYLAKKDDFWFYEYKRNLSFGILSCILFSIYLLSAFWFIYKRHFFSIRWKLISLFLFANLVPILILALLTSNYIESKKISLKNEIIENLDKSIRELDIEYDFLIDEYTTKLNKVSNEFSKKIGFTEIKQQEIDDLNNFAKKLNISYFFLIASDSKTICQLFDENKAKLNSEFLSKMGNAILSFFNNKEIKIDSSDFYTTAFEPRHSDFIRSFLKNLNKVSDILVFEKNIILFSYIFGNKTNYNNNYIMMLFWDKEYFQDLFIKKYFKNIYNNFEKALFYVKSDSGNYWYGSNNLNKIINNVIEKNQNISGKIIGETEINNEKNIYLCSRGINLKNWIFVATYPIKHIDNQINILIIQIIAGIIASLLFTLIIGHMLSLNFLNPIDELRKATIAINNRDFSYSVPIVDEDEFGYLNEVFNRVIEGLGDFEVARIIQESLFPGNNFDEGNIKIFGKSVVMTTLGGDYYDCFKINDEYRGIIIGDVAGHGIPAGLMMVMAKSAVLSAPIEVKLDPATLTSRLHKMFFAIKNERLKRMMTFQYFVLRVSDGHFIYTNAGHCFPVLIDNNKKKAEFIDYIATPLGIGPKCRCKNKEFDLQKGQSLILYTDGIVEASNESGEQYGYDRYIENIPKYYDINPENFYYNLYNNLYKKWSPKPDDDLTLIIINRE